MRHFYEGDVEALRKWAINRGCSGQKFEPPEPFRSWIVSILPEDCRNNLGFWVGIVTPESKLDGDWVKGYPHIHKISRGWSDKTTTTLTYLVAPEEGGEFCLGGLSPDDTYTKIKVFPGLTLSVDSVTWHGVLPVTKGSRMALISTGHHK